MLSVVVLYFQTFWGCAVVRYFVMSYYSTTTLSTALIHLWCYVNAGQMDPAGLCRGLTRWATQTGARVVEGCPVTDIRTTETLLGGRRVTEVHTPYGIIKTNAVVNTTGESSSTPTSSKST